MLWRILITVILTILLLALAYSAKADVYLPIMHGRSAPVLAVPGHGQRLRVDRDWALVDCPTGTATVDDLGSGYILIRCEGQ